MDTVFLLEEYEHGGPLPKSLENILKYLTLNEIAVTKQDMTMVFVYILMLETGFVPFNFGLDLNCDFTNEFNITQVTLLTQILPNNWKQNTSYRFSFWLPICSSYTCRISAVRATHDLIVNCYVNNIPEANFSILLDPSMYVVDNLHFQSLKTLSLKFKDLICYPTKLLILGEIGLPSSGINLMPIEILRKIALLCDKYSLISLSKTSHLLEDIVCVKLYRTNIFGNHSKKVALKYSDMYSKKCNRI